jgi:hypothetical protein
MTRKRNALIASKIFFLGAYVREFPEDWIKNWPCQFGQASFKPLRALEGQKGRGRVNWLSLLELEYPSSLPLDNRALSSLVFEHPDLHQDSHYHYPYPFLSSSVLRSQFLNGNYAVSFPGSLAFELRMTSTTGFSGSPDCRWQIARFLGLHYCIIA